MNMFRRLIAILVLTFSGPAFGADVELSVSTPDPVGKFTVISENQPVPFGGVLFDVEATSYLLTLPDFYQKSYSLECEYLLSKSIAEKDLQIENLQIRIDTQAQQFENSVLQKDLEIDALQTALKKKQLISPWMWGVIGGVVGSGLTIGIVKATQ